jgi:uncharacterized membrane protein
MNTKPLMLLTLLFPVILVAIILPLTARSRRGIVFGVTLPPELFEAPSVVAAIRRFRLSVLLAAAVLVIATVAIFVTGHVNAAAIIASAGIPLLLIFSLVFRAREEHGLRPFAVLVPLTRTAELNPTHSTTPLVAAACAFLPLAATSLWLRMHWYAIPNRWPEHWDAAGHVNGWGHRTTGSVMLPLLIGTTTLVIVLLTTVLTTYAPGPQSRQRGRLAAPLAAMAWTLTPLFCGLALLPLIHVTTVGPILIAVLVQSLLILAIAIWAIIRSGFLAATSPASKTDPYDGTPDSKWHGGLIYYNRTDPAILVAKRFGYGWTLNFGHPLAWLLTGGILLLAVVPAVLAHIVK